MKPARRTFLIQSVAAAAAAGAALIGQKQALAQTQVLSEDDPMAQSLGYKSDASTVDKAKHPNYSPGQSCSNCSFFKGKPEDTSAMCVIFGTKLVSSKGWCGSYSHRS